MNIIVDGSFFHKSDCKCVDRYDKQCDNVDYQLHIPGISFVDTKNIAYCFFKNKKLHRCDGPAVDHITGDKIWCYNGVLHREDGPAVLINNYQQWWFHGKLLSFKSNDKFLDWAKYRAFT